jgi:tubulin polyglutamylase TTLL2
LLISGYKFDLRLYVSIVSISPLTIYAYREGLTRFATEPYDLTDFEKCYSHLTNASLNKLSPGYEIDKEGVGHGCKWTLEKLRKFFRETERTDWFLWQRIMSIIVLTILGEVGHQVGIHSSRNNFEFLGYDILIDRNLQPWLLETNLSPGLGGDCKVDEIVKKPMLHELFDLLGLPDRRLIVFLLLEVKTEDVIEVDEKTNTALRIIPENTDLLEKEEPKINSTVEKTDSERFEEVVTNKINEKICKRPSGIKLAGNSRISPSLKKRLLDVAAIYGQKRPKTKEQRAAKDSDLSQQTMDNLSETSIDSMARLNFIASTDWQGVLGNRNKVSALPHRPGVGLRRRSWYDAPARQGDWVRIFPFDFLSFQMSRGHMSMDLKVIVNHIEKFLRAAENICKQEPLQSDSYYNSKVREDINWNKTFWLPPDQN